MRKCSRKEIGVNARQRRPRTVHRRPWTVCRVLRARVPSYQCPNERPSRPTQGDSASVSSYEWRVPSNELRVPSNRFRVRSDIRQRSAPQAGVSGRPARAKTAPVCHRRAPVPGGREWRGAALPPLAVRFTTEFSHLATRQMPVLRSRFEHHAALSSAARSRPASRSGGADTRPVPGAASARLRPPAKDRRPNSPSHQEWRCCSPGSPENQPAAPTRVPNHI